MPITARASAVAANNPSSQVVKREGAVCAATSVDISVTLKITIDGCSCWIAARTLAAIESGGTVVRMTRDCAGRSLSGKYKSGSAVGFCGSARYFSSSTTPTIVSQGAVEAAFPSLMRLPIGSWPAQNRWATFALTTTTFESGRISLGLERPARSNRDAHRGEEFRSDRVHVGARHCLRAGGRVTLGGVEHGGAAASERNVRDDTRGGHARDRADAIQQ